jgi:hypothetical protein
LILILAPQTLPSIPQSGLQKKLTLKLRILADFTNALKDFSAFIIKPPLIFPRKCDMLILSASGLVQ